MAREGVGGEGGQVLMLLVGGLVAGLAGVFVLGAVARGVGLQGEAQRAADLAAPAGARAMHAAIRHCSSRRRSTACQTRGTWRRRPTSRWSVRPRGAWPRPAAVRRR